MNPLFLSSCLLCCSLVGASRIPINSEKEHWMSVITKAATIEYGPINQSASLVYMLIENVSTPTSDEVQLSQAFASLLFRTSFPRVINVSSFAPYPQGLLDMVKASIKGYIPEEHINSVGPVSDSWQLIVACEKLIRVALGDTSFSFGRQKKPAVFRIFNYFMLYKLAFPNRLLSVPDVSAPSVPRSSGQIRKESETPNPDAYDDRSHLSMKYQATNSSSSSQILQLESPNNNNIIDLRRFKPQNEPTLDSRPNTRLVEASPELHPNILSQVRNPRASNRIPRNPIPSAPNPYNPYYQPIRSFNVPSPQDLIPNDASQIRSRATQSINHPGFLPPGQVNHTNQPTQRPQPSPQQQHPTNGTGGEFSNRWAYY